MEDGENNAPAEAGKDANADVPNPGADGKPTEMTRYVVFCLCVSRYSSSTSTERLCCKQKLTLTISTTFTGDPAAEGRSRFFICFT